MEPAPITPKPTPFPFEVEADVGEVLLKEDEGWRWFVLIGARDEPDLLFPPAVPVLPCTFPTPLELSKLGFLPGETGYVVKLGLAV